MASSPIYNVAIAGASGNVGKDTVSAMLKAGFQVTILTRISSKSSHPSGSGITVKPVDYDSKTSLVEALQGVQGVVSLLSGPAIAIQNSLIDAAIEAGVTRFIPSEFGSNTLDPEIATVPMIAPKADTLAYLRKKADEVPSFSYTAIITGPFLDFCLEYGLIADPKNRKAIIVDDGDYIVSSTPIPEVAKAIAGVFANLEGTKNQVIYTESVQLTQNQVVAIGEKLTGTKWTVEKVKGKDLWEAAWAEISKPEPDFFTYYLAFLRSILFSDKSNFHSKSRNDLVGLKTLPESVIEEELKKYL